jgi:fatty-acyl-CoA synthase
VEDIQKFCSGKIAAYKIPKHIKFVDAFPMTITGKVQKFRMKEISIQELKLEEAAKIETA